MLICNICCGSDIVHYEDFKEPESPKCPECDLLMNHYGPDSNLQWKWVCSQPSPGRCSRPAKQMSKVDQLYYKYNYSKYNTFPKLKTLNEHIQHLKTAMRNVEDQISCLSNYINNSYFPDDK